MGPEVRSDEDLLSARDGATFELFYRRYADRMLGYFVRRTHDAELAADLTAETFAAALTSRRRYRADAGNASAWLFGIASKKLIDAHRVKAKFIGPRLGRRRVHVCHGANVEDRKILARLEIGRRDIAEPDDADTNFVHSLPPVPGCLSQD